MKYKPMLAKKQEGLQIPEEGYWFEEKYDGVRALFEVKKGKVRIYTRNGREVTEKFPELTKARGFKVDGIFDGEICCLDDKGRPHFQTVAGRVHRKGERITEAMKASPVVAFIFDFLQWGRIDLRSFPIEDRLSYLLSYVRSGAFYKRSNVYEDGQGLFEKMREEGREGIIAKAQGSEYLSGRRTNDWLKFKIMHHEDVRIYAYTSGLGKRSGLVGALMVKDSHGNRMKVGTGFTDEVLGQLTDLLQHSVKRVSTKGVHILDMDFPCEVKGMKKNKETGAIREPVFVKLIPKE